MIGLGQEDQHHVTDDQIHTRPGQDGHEGGRPGSGELFPPQQPQEIHPTAAVRHPRHQTIPQNRLPRHDRHAYGVARTAQSSEAALCAALLDAVLRRSTASKKKNSDELFTAVVVIARTLGLIGPANTLAVIDSTGLESRHVSTYYGQRCGQKKRRFPKVSVVVDVKTHLCLAAAVERGPGADDIVFHRLAREAHDRHPFTHLLADAGYDGEHHLAFLHQTLKVIGWIPPRRGRPSLDPDHQPPGPYRRRLHRLWPVAKYGQRWQVETQVSMLKRLLRSALTSRRRHSLDREMYLRLLTLNLMILRRMKTLFNGAVGSRFYALYVPDSQAPPDSPIHAYATGFLDQDD